MIADQRAMSRNRARHPVVKFGSLPANEGADCVDTAADIPSLMAAYDDRRMKTGVKTRLQMGAAGRVGWCG